MDLKSFIKLRPVLFHLTSRENLDSILEQGKLLSTKSIISLANNPDYTYINTTRRAGHVKISVGNNVYSIRDQKPISEKNLKKCLEDNWTCGQFYDHLNNRVFMWSKIEFLNNHYTTYKNEGPVILRFNTEQILNANPHVKFCRLNSGATRSSSHHNGAPPPRGRRTFLSAEEYFLNPASVKEVTYENECVIAGDVFLAYEPYGEYTKIQ